MINCLQDGSSHNLTISAVLFHTYNSDDYVYIYHDRGENAARLDTLYGNYHIKLREESYDIVAADLYLKVMLF